MSAFVRQIFQKGASIGSLAKQLHSLSITSAVYPGPASQFARFSSSFLSSSKITPTTYSSTYQTPTTTRLLTGFLRNFLCPVNQQPVRTKIYYSWQDGKSKNVDDVTDRFFRLRCGMWIRTRAGRNRKKYRKHLRRLLRLQDHVFCTRAQNQLLDKMADKEYKTRKYYLKDPYEHYHKMSNLPIFRTKARMFYP